MNIFLTTPNYVEAAQHLDDLRLNKMILETAQLLSCAYRKLFPDAPQPAVLYKETHINHPCAIWARKSIANYSWLINYFKALHDEKLYRTGNEHLSFVKLFEILALPLYDDKFGVWRDCDDLAVFDFNCTDFKSVPCVYTAYKNALINKWESDAKTGYYLGNVNPGIYRLQPVIGKARVPTWKKRGEPYFYSAYKAERDKQFNLKECA